MDDIFLASYKALKPGGLLGVVEHRANEGTSIEVMKKTGYVTEEYAISMITKHGFEFVASSEINANPKDSKDYKKGVWTLPPTLRLKEKDFAKAHAVIKEPDSPGPCVNAIKSSFFESNPVKRLFNNSVMSIA